MLDLPLKDAGLAAEGCWTCRWKKPPLQPLGRLEGLEGLEEGEKKKPKVTTIGFRFAAISYAKMPCRHFLVVFRFVPYGKKTKNCRFLAVLWLVGGFFSLVFGC